MMHISASTPIRIQHISHQTLTAILTFISIKNLTEQLLRIGLTLILNPLKRQMNLTAAVMTNVLTSTGRLWYLVLTGPEDWEVSTYITLYSVMGNGALQ